ncbi:hypothetical protein QL285_045944 [Trifolium repens]|nr:hypothetical protein QL285_045944 [Trifolium repens]
MVEFPILVQFRTNCKLKLPSQLTITSHFARSTSSSKANKKMKKMQAEIDSLKDNPSQVDILKEQVAFFSYCKCKTVGKIRYSKSKKMVGDSEQASTEDLEATSLGNI